MDGRTGRRRSALLAAGTLSVALALAGCSAGDSGSADSAGPAAKAPLAEAGAADKGSGADAAGAGAGAPDLRVDQRAIIYTGTMRVQVANVDDAAREVNAAVTRAGGFIGGDQRRSADADAVAELQLRVPAAKFAGVVEEVAKLGRQESREINTQDVTEETVDLEARIITQRARVDSARRLLARASSIADLVSLENELGRREADLASLEAKKRRLADLTALSTITVSLAGPAAKTSEEKTETGFLVGLKGGWGAFVTSMTILLTVLGALLPWLVAFGVPLAVLLVALRRRRKPPALVATGVSAPPPVPAARSAP
ncbi:Lipoprotein [Micromonospora lupini str. Lupac 08]|uniref:Lipoprotein n=2 Tax=Micromonospora lupini TaxID=285679 RepID=I0KWP0_9ACTN|nr:Lipoprotein [Micromonospora lupini str. Lupac 08]